MISRRRTAHFARPTLALALASALLVPAHAQSDATKRQAPSPVVAPAQAAQPSAKKPEAPARPAAAKSAAAAPPPPGKFAVVNKNSSVMLSLRLGNTVSDENAVARDLEPGNRILLSLPVKGRCKYDVHATFKDWSSIDIRDVDLCADRNLILTE